jgi:hypothetical protein
MTTPAGGATHLERDRYACALQALLDARRVLEDLRQVAGEQTVIATADIEFLTRRASQLVDACIDAHEGIPA